MEYAIIEIGGHQFWIEKGQYLIINKVSIDKKSKITCGSTININRILLINKNNNISFGYPYLVDSIVQGQILEYLKGSKITIYKIAVNNIRFTKIYINEITINKIFFINLGKLN